MSIDDLISSLGSVSDSSDLESIVNYIEGWKDDDTTVANLEETVELLLETVSFQNEQMSSFVDNWQHFRDNTIVALGGMTINERIHSFGLYSRFETSQDKSVVYEKLHAGPFATLKYDKKLSKIMEVFDRVFNKMGQTVLSKNSAFVLDELSTEYWQRYSSKLKENRVNVVIELFNGGASFWVDRIRECPEWGYQSFEDNYEEIEEIILELFQSRVQVEYKGGRTKVKLIDEEERVIRQFKQYEGCGCLPINAFLPTHYKRTYDPFFEKNNKPV